MRHLKYLFLAFGFLLLSAPGPAQAIKPTETETSREFCDRCFGSGQNCQCMTGGRRDTWDCTCHGGAVSIDRSKLDSLNYPGLKAGTPANRTFFDSFTVKLESKNVVTIAVDTCQAQELPLLREPIGTATVEYKEVRFCNIPLPDKAVIKNITAAALRPDDNAMIHGSTYNPRTVLGHTTWTEIILVKNSLNSNGYQRKEIKCDDTERGSGYSPRFFANNEVKRFDCPPTEASTDKIDYTLKLETAAFPRGHTMVGQISSLKSKIFPFVKLIQVEYELNE